MFKKRGKIFHSPHLTLTVYEAAQMKNNKFSFVVSKKVSKKSVVRNKLKRTGYDTIRSLMVHIKEKGVSCGAGHGGETGTGKLFAEGIFLGKRKALV